ncbi:rRNA methyltransferase [Treponema sp. OttesenSCG-928-L16]|nr:rRNA methyltransferase [Treponema sp. OttesenSCG-928-L16]
MTPPKNAKRGTGQELFLPLTGAIRKDIERLMECTEAVFPLPARFRSSLSRDIAALSRLLTSERSERDGGYLGKPSMQSAYLRFFLPWNVYRLCRLLPSLPLSLKAGDALTDLGSGPLTFPLALWISRPELRKLSLEIRCLDHTASVLDTGRRLFEALAGPGSPWRIKTIRASLGNPVYGNKAALVTAVNVFNEIFWDDHRLLQGIVKKNAAYLRSLAEENGSLLVAEPGIPRSGEFISLLRSELMKTSSAKTGGLSPCPHCGSCPFPGGKGGAKWCHFAFDTDDAPRDLLRLSEAAALPKERAVLSYLFLGPGNHFGGNVRILSDLFPLGEKAGGKARSEQAEYGRYGCSEKGMVLVAGQRRYMKDIPSGTLLDLAMPDPARRDVKSRAMVLDFSG